MQQPRIFSGFVFETDYFDDPGRGTAQFCHFSSRHLDNVVIILLEP
jgi:hypothetical protein